MTITTRAGKGSPLTNAEMDANLTAIDADITAIEADLTAIDADITAIQTITSRLPSTLSGQAGKGLRVNSAESAYESVGLLNMNRLINGDLSVWQEASSYTGKTASFKAADMWVMSITSSGTWTVDRSTDVPTVAQAGRLLNYSIRALCTTADATVNTGDLAWLGVRVEGYDYLTLYQQTQTVQFWVKSSKTGVYCVALRNSGADRSYISQITVNAADTWEKKTVTVTASPSGGTWDFTTGVGLELAFTLVSGATFHTTANAWQSGNYFATSSQVNLADTINSYIRVADVRLVPGVDASNVIVPSYGERLASCQRYYETTSGLRCINTGSGSASVRITWVFSVEKRASPTVTAGTGSTESLTAKNVTFFQSTGAGSTYDTGVVTADARL
jgi:hypothetical protein